MKVSTRRVDNQGRIVIPSHIRKQLDIGEGDPVDIEIAKDGTMRLKRGEEHCCLCHKVINHKTDYIVFHGKFICSDCCDKIRKSI